LYSFSAAITLSLLLSHVQVVYHNIAMKHDQAVQQQQQQQQQQALLIQQQREQQEAAKKKMEEAEKKRIAAAQAAGYGKNNNLIGQSGMIHANNRPPPNVSPGFTNRNKPGHRKKPVNNAPSPILPGSAVGSAVAMTMADTASIAVPQLSTTNTTAPATKLQPHQQQPPPKEYADLMELVDHATNYDAKSCVMLLGPKHQIEFQDDTNNGSSSSSSSSSLLKLSEEQNNLLHSGGLLGTNHHGQKPPPSGSSHWTPSLPPHRKGWGQRNIVSARVAWAKLRLMERKESDGKAITLPGGGGGGGTATNKGPLPSKTLSSSTTNDQNSSNALNTDRPQKQQPQPQQRPASSPDFGKNTTEWFNEEKAEHDEALALISEGTQLYIRKILEGAISAARHRLNLDGVRLWHQQHAAAAAANLGNAASTTGGSSAAAGNNGSAGARSVQSTPSKEVPQPPLLLRLGCDVSRQYALTQGNAAKVCQRMEEALLRSGTSTGGNDPNDGGDGRSSLADAETLYQATSMAELSQLPTLPSASKNADYHAKRRFEVYGGKDSGLPPFGRLPKKVRITPRDVQFCLSEDSSLARLHSKRRVARVFM